MHRDLKSPNLCVDKNWTVKVCDFNLSKVMVATMVTGSTSVVSPRWMAPEVLSGEKFSKAADAYSFGVILWELLTLQVPFSDLSSWQIMQMVGSEKRQPPLPSMPDPAFIEHEAYTQLIKDCWQEEPSDRPTFSDVNARLEAMLDAETKRAVVKNRPTPKKTRILNAH
jgi:sterile alpha motif and leucine zipper-containing kinase AZK